MKKHIYWIVLLITILSQSCSAPYHFDRFQKKGGKVNCITDTLIVNDTLLINGDTVIVPREHYIVKDSIYYVTKWETKYKYKTIKVQEKTAQIEAKQEGKTEREEIKQEGKTKRTEARQSNKWWNWLIVIIILIGGFMVLRFLINTIKNRYI